MEKSEEELKSLLMKMKEESEKAGLKYNIRGEQDGRGVGGCGVHLFKCMKNTSREQTGVLDQQKRIYRTMQNLVEQKNHKRRNGGEQDGGGVGGCGLHLSPQIHQEYTFRHRSACKTPVRLDRGT